MRARALGAALAAALLGVPLGAGAQPTPKVARIGFLEAGSVTANRHFLDAFRRGLHELGYVEGQNVAIEQRWADGRNDRFPELLAELLRARVEVLVSASTPGAVAAKAATSTVPVVFVGVADPVGAHLVASLGRPGGNMTGLSLGDDLGLDGKRLELLREMIPKASRVGVLWNSTAAGLEARVKALQSSSSGIAIESFPVRDAPDFDAAVATMKKARVDALYVLTDPLTFRHRRLIIELAARYQIPASYGFGDFARGGGLMAYSASVPELFRRAATYVDRILKGARPAELPVEQPTKFELVVNTKTAGALGLAVPPSLLLRADEVL